jgi:Spy/CpxP family protein refolding chaperone
MANGRWLKAFVTAAALGLAVPATSAFAQGGGGGMMHGKDGKKGKDGKFGKGAKGMGGPMFGKGPHKALEGLDLTAEQKTKIDELRKGNRDKLKELREAMRAKHEELAALLTGDGSADKARAVHGEAQSIRQKMDDLHFESMLAIREILTPEQRKKFGEAMGRRHPHGGPGGGPGGMDGGGMDGGMDGGPDED